MSSCLEPPGSLPAKDFCNRDKKNPNPINGFGPLGNRFDDELSYSKGDAANQVKRVQEMLTVLGLGSSLGDTGRNKDGIDGDFGPKTEQTVVQFQKDRLDWEGLPLVQDGKVGPRTADAINRALVQAGVLKCYQTPVELTEDFLLITTSRQALQEVLTIEVPDKVGRVRIVIASPLGKSFIIVIHDRFGSPVPEVDVDIELGDRSSRVKSDKEGKCLIQGVGTEETAFVSYSVKGDRFRQQAFLDVRDINTNEGIRRRLHNLGFLKNEDLSEAISSFQSFFDLDVTAESNEETRRKLSQVHDGEEQLVNPDLGGEEVTISEADMVGEGPIVA